MHEIYDADQDNTVRPTSFECVLTNIEMIDWTNTFL